MFGWMPCRRPRLALLVASWVVFAAGCTGETPSGQQTDDAWILEEDAGEADTGSEDTGSPDGSVDCRQIDDASTCRSQSACDWWENQCSDDPEDAGCFEEGNTPDIAHCPHPAPCRELEGEQRCLDRSECNWISKECPGGSTVGQCLGPADAEPVLECPDEGCADLAPRRCTEGECSPVAPGCGDDNPEEFDSETCLPKGICETHDDCKDGLICMGLMVEPDCDRCDVCASGSHKCVPEEWGEDRHDERCRDLSTEVCGETDRCRMVYPSQCNEAAPEGSQTFEEPTCLPAESCGNGGTCSSGYVCATLWRGCGPNAYCLKCGHTEERCLRMEE